MIVSLCYVITVITELIILYCNDINNIIVTHITKLIIGVAWALKAAGHLGEELTEEARAKLREIGRALDDVITSNYYNQYNIT